MFGGFAGERDGGDAHAADGWAGGANLDGGDAGNDVGRADGDEELEGAGGDLLEDVLVADVGVGEGGGEGEEKDECETKRRKRTPGVETRVSEGLNVCTNVWSHL